jgi:YD repeat-containing protein
MVVALVALALGCAQSEPAESELAAACFTDVELEAWPEKFAVYDWCSSEVDRGVDGDIDARKEQRFDADGNLIWRLEDMGVETTLEYDELGRLTRIERADEEDVLQWIEQRVYDGRASLIERDTDADGDIDVLEHNTYECFPEGDAWPYPGPCTTRVDSDADGVIDGVTVFEYEDEEISSRLSTTPDGEPRRSRYFYDEDGEIARIEHDDGDDGTIDSLYKVERIDAHTTRAWQGDPEGENANWTDIVTDDEGRVISESMFGQDGLFARNQSVWSADGRSVRVTTTSSDNPEQDTIIERRFDAAGNVVGMAVDKNPLGSPDECIYTSYACWDR